MHNLKDVESVIAKMIANQSKSRPTDRVDAHAMINEQLIENIYSETIIPIYQMLHILYDECKIDSEQFNKRLTSLTKLLKLIEGLLPKDSAYQYIAIIQVDDVQQHRVFLNIIQDLLHLEHIYPIVTSLSISPHTIKQLTDTSKMSNLRRLALLHSIAHRPQKNSVNLTNAKVKVVHPHQLTKFIRTFPYLLGQSIRIADWLF